MAQAPDGINTPFTPGPVTTFRLCDPTPFNGDPDQAEAFLHQVTTIIGNVELYLVDYARIEFVVSLLTGEARIWAMTFANLNKKRMDLYRLEQLLL
jgi:hypothetical protein